MYASLKNPCGITAPGCIPQGERENPNEAVRTQSVPAQDGAEERAVVMVGGEWRLT